MVNEQKWDRLKDLLREMQLAVLAYSGGVDSSLLLRAAAEVMGPRIIAVTAVSETYPPGELASAKAFARSLGVTHKVLHTEELSKEEFAQNPPDRCYHCKRELFGKLSELAEKEGISCIIDGSNADDAKDYRPGSRAAQEFSVRSPLREAGLTKSEIRELARSLGLSVWDKPSLACLSSRIPYGTRITKDILEMVQKAEDCLRSLGFRQVRVRHHVDTARIEIAPEDFGSLLSSGAAKKIAEELKVIGYTYVCLDLEGYRTGSMNAALGSGQRAWGMRGAESREHGAKGRKSA